MKLAERVSEEGLGEVVNEDILDEVVSEERLGEEVRDEYREPPCSCPALSPSPDIMSWGCELWVSNCNTNLTSR